MTLIWSGPDTLDARWWDNAKAEDIVRVHQTATAWKGQDLMARSAADAIREQVQHATGSTSKPERRVWGTAAGLG
ncbi:hypothetical protein [Pseudarthrobacter sp. NS4]|uniref:hypothetical protein n=1 Tax=Pseudarthrobacter sp. NS4 TaxID=2973976 RepID=UPI002162EE55|nr:hypothetical protein [Pseudarthrobacter sp. NS4]